MSKLGSYVIRGKSGIRFQSCEIGIDQEESYCSLQEAENALKQIKESIPFDEYEIIKI